MAKRRAKKTAKRGVTTPGCNVNVDQMNEPPIEKDEYPWIDQEVERQSAAIRAMRDVEIEHLLTSLRLLRSYFNEKQLQTSLPQFFRENLPDLSIQKSVEEGEFEVKWKDKDGNLSMNNLDEGDIHVSLLRRMSMAYPDCSFAFPSFGGCEFSSKSVKTTLLDADNLQIRKFALDEPSDSQTLAVPDALRTPGATSQRLSMGITPKTLRQPKHGEMLLSVRGSPLGVYKEDNMEAIHEAEEG